MDANPGAITPGSAACGALHKPRCFIVAQRMGRESRSSWCPWVDPINPERTPICAISVPAKQVPATAPNDEPLWLRSPHALPAVVVHIIEAQALAGSDCARDCAQHREINRRASSRDSHCRGPHGIDAVPQAAREHLLKLDERS